MYANFQPEIPGKSASFATFSNANSQRLDREDFAVAIGQLKSM
jgi:hypothetical protein